MLQKILFRFFLLFLSALAVSACQTVAPERVETASSSQSAPPNLVQGVCGDCHGVEPPFLSPNPAAPSFDDIANRQGMSEKSLTSWLIEAHNYPELMDFELSQNEAGEVARYLISLQREDYKKAP